MKRLRTFSVTFKKGSICAVRCLIYGFLLMVSHAAFSQGKQYVQVKTFDASLKRITDVELSINGKPFFKVGGKGEAMVELDDEDFPLKSITVKDQQFEVASWNNSKGVIEIIIRKKTYKIVLVYVQDNENNALKNVSVRFKGTKVTTATTGQDGKIEIPLGVEEKITSEGQFSVDDYQVVNLLSTESGSVLTVKRKSVAAVPQEKVTREEVQIDSIKSLEEFYALFKNYQTRELTEETRNRLNAKLKSLMEEFADSVKGNEINHVEKITETSAVGTDIKNIISQASIENEKLAHQREEFNDKIRVINQKLAQGILNIDDSTRATLLADITRLEIILESNRSTFYKNQEDYRAILNAIKDKFLHIEDLEDKLTMSEAQRQEEQEAFKRKMIITISIAVLSALLMLLLVYFSSKLRKQKRDLIMANAEVKHVNENLEHLILERTHMLEAANRELDTFLYKASHNLRSPVSSIIGLHNIANLISNPESMELFDRAVQTAYAMDRLLRKLTLISEINRPENFSHFAIRPLIEETQKHFEKQIRERGVTVSLECPAELMVHSNKNLVEAILFGLIENAIFYSALKREGTPEVQIQVRSEADYVSFIIYDNGVGIPLDIQGRIYEMFFVGNEQSEGNGLGLYIVQKSVQAIQGSISVESEAYVYTRFIVRIPLTPEIK
jgi:signal transduction histidine kinase